MGFLGWLGWFIAFIELGIIFILAHSGAIDKDKADQALGSTVKTVEEEAANSKGVFDKLFRKKP